MINKVILIGNLGKDPEVRHLENGAMVARFSMATNENYRDKSGEWQSQTEWHDVVAWRFLAERAERELRKGKLVYVEGKLTHRKYTDQNNVERYVTEVVANVIRLLERGSDRPDMPTGEDMPDAYQTSGTGGFDTPGSQTSAPSPGSDAHESGGDLPF